MGDLKKYEYIWLDGFQPEPSMRSKIKVTDEDTPPEWSFDGSSTQQAEGDSSDCLLLPVKTHPSNTRAAADAVVSDEWWFGFEQEYFFTNKDGSPLGWEEGEPRPQGDYYCGVGADNVSGREVSEAHLDACLAAGINLTGTNAEVALGQWEYQCFC